MDDPRDRDTTDRRERVRVTDTPEYQEQEHVVHDVAAERRYSLDRVSQLIWLIFGILEGLILLRVILKLIAANPDNAFASFIYGITDPFLAPFFGLTGTPGANGVVLEIPSLIAMIIYALIAWVLVRLVWLLFDRPATRRVSTYEREES